MSNKEPPSSEIVLNNVPIKWDLERGTFTFFGLPSALFWINPSLLKMLEPIAQEIGLELFRLMVAHSSSMGTEEDYHAIVTELGKDFEEGFLKWGEAVSTAGWGTFELPHCDLDNKVARVRVSNSWEMLLEASGGKHWGAPFIQGKIIGIFSQAFGTNCWADEVNVSYDENNPFVEFQVYQSNKTIEDEIESIRLQKLSDQERILHNEVKKTTRKLVKTNEELVVAKENAEAYSKAKSEFLGIMSHELRTPMTGVIGFSDLLLQEDLSPSARDHVYRIKSSTNSLLKLINDILDMSKMDAGKMEIESIDFDIRDLIEETLVMFERSRKSDQHLTLNLSYSQDFPRHIKADPTRLKSILMNLVGNAMKFTSQGEVNVVCEVSLDSNDQDELNISVQDTGIGIHKDVLPRLFEDFTQADASISRKYEGSGLGLAICKRLVALMNGRISVESEEGVGSTFRFSIPYRPSNEPTRPVEKRPSDTFFKSRRHLNILIAEDNRINQKIMRALMENYGHNVHVVENGLEAVSAFKENTYDLILMDIRMPEMNGTDATKAIRQADGEGSRVPIIAVTADALPEHVDNYLGAGMDGYVAKPIDLSKLVLMINDVLGEEVHVEITPLATSLQKNGAGKKLPEKEDPQSDKNEGEADPEITSLLKQFEVVADETDDV